MSTYGALGLVVLGCVLAFVVFRTSSGALSPEPPAYTRVIVPGAAGKLAADSGIPAPDPLRSRQPEPTAAGPASSAGRAACAADGGDCELSVRYDCDPRKLRCRRAPPQCADGQVPSVDGSCFGECVRIEACRCTGPEECPSHDQYTCLLSARHCTPYLH